jgi:DNA-binding NarL/FixJ family response regulator
MIAHILIVDADCIAARVTEALVARLVSSATRVVEPTAEGGRRHVHQQPPDMLLLDLSPNQLADDRLIREVKAFNPHALVIALTSLTSPAARRRLRDRQIDVYVEKGCAPEVLVSALRNAREQFSLLKSQRGPAFLPLCKGW